MSETVELRLYSPLQIDVIDRDISDRAIPLQAADQERRTPVSRGCPARLYRPSAGLVRDKQKNHFC